MKNSSSVFSRDRTADRLSSLSKNINEQNEIHSAGVCVCVCSCVRACTSLSLYIAIIKEEEEHRLAVNRVLRYEKLKERLH